MGLKYWKNRGKNGILNEYANILGIIAVDGGLRAMGGGFAGMAGTPPRGGLRTKAESR